MRRLLAKFKKVRHEHCWHREDIHIFDGLVTVFSGSHVFLSRTERGYSCCFDGCRSMARG